MQKIDNIHLVSYWVQTIILFFSFFHPFFTIFSSSFLFHCLTNSLHAQEQLIIGHLPLIEHCCDLLNKIIFILTYLSLLKIKNSLLNQVSLKIISDPNFYISFYVYEYAISYNFFFLFNYGSWIIV